MSTPQQKKCRHRSLSWRCDKPPAAGKLACEHHLEVERRRHARNVARRLDPILAAKDAACSRCGALRKRKTSTGMCPRCYHKECGRRSRAALKANHEAYAADKERRREARATKRATDAGYNAHVAALKAIARENRKAKDPKAEWLTANFTSSKSGARRRGKEFRICRADLLPLPDFCPVLGIHLEYACTKPQPESPSIDRIDNRIGYRPGNVRVISLRANRLKSDASPTELVLIGKDAETIVSARSHACQ